MSHMHVGLFMAFPPHAHTAHRHLACEFTDGSLCFLHRFLSSSVTLLLAKNMSSYQHIMLQFLHFPNSWHFINSLNNHSSMHSLRSIFISVLFYKSPLWLILYSHIWNNDHMSAHMRVSDVCLLKCRQLCWPFSAYFKKTGTGSFTAWDEMIFSSSFVMRQREIFDLEWLDNHP